MPTKQDLIDNIQEYEPLNIAGYIRDGVVTFEELCREPEFSAAARKEVQKYIASFDDEAWEKAKKDNTAEAYERYLMNYREGAHRQEARDAKNAILSGDSVPTPAADDNSDDAWFNVDKTNSDAIRAFLTSHPDSPHAPEAKKLWAEMAHKHFSVKPFDKLKQQIKRLYRPDAIVSTIKQAIASGEVSEDDIYNEIARDHNWLPSFIIQDLEREGTLNLFDLEEKSKIQNEFLGFIANDDARAVVVDVDPLPIDALPPTTTEVYFWGIPASGKTCALGAIMNEARYGGYVEFAEPNINCKGFHYMNVVSQLFTPGKNVVKLPEGTQTKAIFDMGFIFKKGKYDYPVTFVDLPGETINSMYEVNGCIPLDQERQAALDKTIQLLKGNAGVNRKMHFFVLEYNGHDSLYKGRTQDVLLTSAMTFIKNTGIFKTETDAVFLLVTKSDLTGAQDPVQRNQILAEYIRQYYGTFYNGLKKLCGDNEINGGNVDIIPFSIGEVCFKNLCLYQRTTAAEVVKIILERAGGVNRGRAANLLNIFKK